MSLFLRLLEADDKAAALREAVQAVRSDQPDARVFDVEPEGFRQVPGAAFAYWVSDRVLFSFVEFSAFAAEGRSAVSGGKTLDDFRWIRASWEFDVTNRDHWKGFAKGAPIRRNMQISI